MVHAWGADRGSFPGLAPVLSSRTLPDLIFTATATLTCWESSLRLQHRKLKANPYNREAHHFKSEKMKK